MVAGLSVVGLEVGFSRGGRRAGSLEDISFEVDAGEVVAVSGGRLSGKTTLLEVVAGMKGPDRGTVSLDGRELTGLPERVRARLLGHEIMWIDRGGPDLDVEVSRFVGWPLALHGRRDAERTATRALERVGAQGCIGRRWGELSNWQRVLVGLARAFAGSPRVVVIDDLLDALGSRATEEASDLLRSLVADSAPRCAVLMSASDMESAVFADRVWLLTRKGALKLLCGRPSVAGDVIPFPSHTGALSREA
jgi:predicted ABC-type transport system involved in lysophospholipase L1 biosynthesis ATPase subunit